MRYFMPAGMAGVRASFRAWMPSIMSRLSFPIRKGSPLASRLPSWKSKRGISTSLPARSARRWRFRVSTSKALRAS